MQYPVFVPFRDQRVAAIVTVPETSPRSATLLLQGLGSTRSHRYAVWTRTAEALAERGIATVRMDYPDMGDSTPGMPREFGFDCMPLDEVKAVIETTLPPLGVDRFGVAGNCFGARIGLALATLMPGCVSVGCIVLGSPKSILAGQGWTATGRAVRSHVRGRPRLASAIRRIVPTEKIKPRVRFIPEISAAVQTASLLVLFFGKEETGWDLAQSVEELKALRRPPGRVEIRSVNAAGTSGFRLTLDQQDFLIDSLVSWMDETLPPEGANDWTPADATLVATRRTDA